MDNHSYAGSSRAADRLAPLDTSLSNQSDTHGYATGLALPMTPATPMGDPSTGKPRKVNPLVDLVETEKAYVERLTGIIRKVASAWSRSNLPPPELDKMFRGIEQVYKANRSLVAKLNEIGGADPANANPKALGDLLMRWIDDLEQPYTNFCSRFISGFDRWSPVQTNARLMPVLEAFSETHPPPDGGVWTLDSLFLLPKSRIKYYRKLYGRLLKSTQEGRSDHRLLVGAVEKLDQLQQTLDQRAQIDIGSFDAPLPPAPIETVDEVVIDMTKKSGRDSNASGSVAGSVSGSFHASSSSGSPRPSNVGPAARTSTSTISSPLSDLERRLETSRCLDIFAMKPKAVMLKMNPPTLAFAREMLASADCTIAFVPRTTGVEVMHQRGHIFVLSDLFLMAERMTLQERANFPEDGPDMWLLYPPLAGKHLRIHVLDGQPNAFQVTIMKKEVLTITTDSQEARDFCIDKFKECVAFAANLAQAAKAPPPPMPSLDAMVRPSPTVSPIPSHPPSQVNSRYGSPASERAFSPTQGMRQSPMVGSVINNDNSRPPSQSSSLHESVRPLHIGARTSDPPPLSMSPPAPGPPRSYAHGPAPPFGDRIGSPDSLPPLPAPHAPFATPMRPGSAPLPDKPMPPAPGGPMSAGEHPQYGGGFGPGQVMPQRGMPPGPGSGPGGLPGRPYPPGGMGMGPPPHMQQGPHMGPNGIPLRNATMGAFDPRGQPPGPGPYGAPPGPPGGPMGMRKAASSGALAAQYEQAALNGPRPPMPGMPGGPPGQSDALLAPRPRMLLPSALQERVVSSVGAPPLPGDEGMSPPNSPPPEEQPTGPVVSTVTAEMRCKIFHQQQHQQWKSLGGARLRLYQQQPTNVKQLVVQAEDKKQTVLVSTIVLADGVERVGKTGVAIELSDAGKRTGIVYMIQCKNEQAANGFFNTLLMGSDRKAQR